MVWTRGGEVKGNDLDLGSLGDHCIWRNCYSTFRVVRPNLPGAPFHWFVRPWSGEPSSGNRTWFFDGAFLSRFPVVAPASFFNVFLHIFFCFDFVNPFGEHAVKHCVLQVRLARTSTLKFPHFFNSRSPGIALITPGGLVKEGGG